MRRLAIALITAALALAVGLGLRRAQRRAQRHRRRVPAPSGDCRRRSATANAVDLAPVDVLQVSGLFDAVIVDSIQQRHRRQRGARLAGADPAAQHRRRRRLPRRR